LKAGNQVLIEPQLTSWQEKLDFGFCTIKSIVFAMLVVEVILVFLIRHRLRIAWAVMLNRFGRKFDG
jgi:hypothetical protein